ncbi:PPOX class F420-dependent oxidoreductase [Streptomyces sp. 4N509B]|uniref:PPOX class F420-dependent oxidoreductase n=1 Tax=Streptomyces sp. 4N509B TaxID=3457413 RepID=UPI003FD30516
MAKRMSESEWQRFVSHGTRTGKVAVVLRDGRPHVSPVWFLVDRGDLLFVSPGDSVKAKRLRRDPRATVCVDVESLPFAYVMLSGDVTLDDDPALVDAWMRRIEHRYDPGRKDPADRRLENPPPVPDVLVRLRPSKVIAMDFGG